MMNLLLKVLREWSELGRYPDLLLIVGREAERLAPEEALVKLLEGIASPRTHQEGFAELLQRGEFRGAEGILAIEPFKMTPSGLKIEVLKADLARARQEAQDETQLRIVSLRRRAELVGQPPAMPAGIEDAARDSRGRAAELLGEWEARIREAESRVSGIFLKGNDINGTAAPSPAQVSRLPPWPWAAKGSEVLKWYHDEGLAPVDFHTRWKPSTDDASARALIAALEQLQKGTVTAVTAFASALDAFLGSAEMARGWVEHPEGVETRLFAPVDRRLPCLAANGSDGVRFWVPKLAAVGPPPSGASRLVLGFSERLPARLEPDHVWFDLASLLRLIPDRQNRLLNFLRDIGSRVPLAHAVPSGIEMSSFPSGQTGEAEAFIRWMFDILNINAEDAALADMIVYYSGGKMEIMLPLLRSLLESHPNRQIPLTKTALACAWESNSFREPARAALLHPIEFDPLARAALGAILYLGQPLAWSATLQEVVLALEVISEDEINELKIREALDRLVRCGLLVCEEGAETYRTPTSGIVSLLLAAIPDAVTYVRQAVSE